MAAFEHVLIIDDSEIDVLINRRLIELTNFSKKISVSTTAEDALHFLKEECNASNAPEWIFLDMHLPGMNGYEFIEEFKTLPGYILSRTKIIILSVFQKQERLEKALQYPFIAGQLEKPLVQQSLRDIAQGIGVKQL